MGPWLNSSLWGRNKGPGPQAQTRVTDLSQRAVPNRTRRFTCLLHSKTSSPQDHSPLPTPFLPRQELPGGAGLVPAHPSYDLELNKVFVWPEADTIVPVSQ